MRTCLTCGHKDRRQIEKLIIAGTPFRRIASQYGMSDAAIRRHLKHCLGEKAAKEARAKKDSSGREIVLAKAATLWEEATKAGQTAKKEKQTGFVIASVNAREKLLGLEAQVRGAFAPVKSEVELGGSLEVSPAEAERFRALLAAVRTEAPDVFEAILKRWGVQLPGEGK